MILEMGTWGFAIGIILLIALLWIPLHSRLGWWKRFYDDPRTRRSTQAYTILFLIGIGAIIYGISEWHKSDFEICVQEALAYGDAINWDQLNITEGRKQELATLACQLEREYG